MDEQNTPIKKAPEKSNSDTDQNESDSAMSTNGEEVEVKIEERKEPEEQEPQKDGAVGASNRDAAAGVNEEQQPEEPRYRPRRDRNDREERERRLRVLHRLLLPPWLRWHNRWTVGFANRAATGRRPGRTQKDDEEQDAKSVYRRKFFWTCYPETGFPHRVNHALIGYRCANEEYCTYSFGGYHAEDDERTVLEADNSGGPFFKSSPIDIHRFDMDTLTCTLIKPVPVDVYVNVEPFERAKKIPGCRYGHTVCEYKNQVYMFGGRNDEDGSFSKVECYDLIKNVWIKVHPVGEIPPSRDGHACTRFDNEMIIHGGFSADEVRFSGETMAFNLDTHVWRTLDEVGLHVPERDFHTATAANRKMLVFGGRSDLFAPYFTASDVYDEVFYLYDYDKGEWVELDVTGYRVRGRRSHCATSIGNNIIFFGGYNASTKEHFGDIFIVDIDTAVITEIRPFGEGPCPRRRAACAVVGSELFICGGTSPVEVVRDGETKEILHDHNDVYILHLLPTLEQLCTTVLLKENIDLSKLPPPLQRKLEVIHKTQINPIKKLPAEDLG